MQAGKFEPHKLTLLIHGEKYSMNEGVVFSLFISRFCSDDQLTALGRFEAA